MLYRMALAFLIGIGSAVWLTYTFNSNFLKDHQEFSYHFQLVDPEQAPASIKPSVMRGLRILMETKKYLPEYAGDQISCTNCHFAEGNTLGGEGNGISLVGVTRFYKEPHALQNRINACFSKSLHGKPLPIEGEEMKAIVAYLDWISSPTQNLTSIPWRGVKPLRSWHVPDAKEGAKVYMTYCASCHGADGQGERRESDLSYPPLWGEAAFTKNAGMGKLETLASFAYYNMPYDEPNLTVEEILDVSAFIISQPHPNEKR